MVQSCLRSGWIFVFNIHFYSTQTVNYELMNWMLTIRSASDLKRLCLPSLVQKCWKTNSIRSDQFPAKQAFQGLVCLAIVQVESLVSIDPLSELYPYLLNKVWPRAAWFAWYFGSSVIAMHQPISMMSWICILHGICMLHISCKMHPMHAAFSLLHTRQSSSVSCLLS